MSDTSFISDLTMEKLGIEGSPATLSLSTMSAKREIIPCREVSDISVRAADFRGIRQRSDDFPHENTVEMSKLYTRDVIPCDTSHIATPRVARGIPHLAVISYMSIGRVRRLVSS